MKSVLFIIVFLLTYSASFSQGRMVINNDAHITFSNGNAGTPAFIVIDNPNANAITTTGSGGHIHSENEYHKIRWNIGTSTGNYVIPFSTGGNVKIPYQMQITGAGIGGTHIDFSTYPTSIMNTPWPSMVTHMLDAATGTVDNSMNVIDRFWIVDAMNYGTRPTTTMQFGYDPNELAGNSVAAGSLEAQRFNSSGNVWSGSPSMSSLSWGVDNAGAQRVENAAIPNGEFFEAWTLVNMNDLLPVTLTDFEGNCSGKNITLQWETASENNASYYEVQKSSNGQDWSTIGSVDASGTTNTTSFYEYTDPNTMSFVSYYRLKQYDNNGESTSFNAISVEGCNNINDNDFSVTDYHNGRFVINLITDAEQTLTMNLYDVSGKKVMNSNLISAKKGENTYEFNYPFMSDGMYILILENQNQKLSKKLMMLDY